MFFFSVFSKALKVLLAQQSSCTPELGSLSGTSLVKTLTISEPQTFHVSSGVKFPFCILRVFKSETDLVQRGVNWHHHYHLMDDHSPPCTYAHTLPSL